MQAQATAWVGQHRSCECNCPVLLRIPYGVAADLRDDARGLGSDWPHLGKFFRLVRKFVVRIGFDAGGLIKCGERLRSGERISCAMAEGMVSAVVSKRLANRQRRQVDPAWRLPATANSHLHPRRRVSALVRRRPAGLANANPTGASQAGAARTSTDVKRHAAALRVVSADVNLSGDGVFASVEPPVVARGQVTAISRQVSLAPGVDGGLAPLQMMRSAWRQLTASDALVDAGLLVLQPIVNFAGVRRRYD